MQCMITEVAHGGNEDIYLKYILIFFFIHKEVTKSDILGYSAVHNSGKNFNRKRIFTLLLVRIFAVCFSSNSILSGC